MLYWICAGGTSVAAGRVRCEQTDRLLQCIDVLVDGPFIEAQKDISLRFRGSPIQRLMIAGYPAGRKSNFVG